MWTWFGRSGVWAALVGTALVAVAGRVLTGSVSTPQMSGAAGTVTAAAAVAAVSGAAASLLLPMTDRAELARAGRGMRLRRQASFGVVVLLGLVINGAGPRGLRTDSCGTYLFFAALTLLVTRFSGLLASAAAFSAYVGLCLFFGMARGEVPRWWASPVFAAATPSWHLVVISCTAVVAGLVATWRVPRS